MSGERQYQKYHSISGERQYQKYHSMSGERQYQKYHSISGERQYQKYHSMSDTFNTDVLAFIGNVLMHLTSHRPIISRISVSSLINSYGKKIIQ